MTLSHPDAAVTTQAKIHVVHAVPEVAQSFGIDHDGFTAAVDVLAERHDVTWLNVHPANADAPSQAARIADADFVLVRSDWGWYPCAAADRALRGSQQPVGLLIAGSHAPPSNTEALRFDVLFYETPWYAPLVQDHPFAVEAFGVDTRSMNPGTAERDIDWLMVGRLAEFKRPLQLMEKSGRRVAVGDLASAPAEIRRALEADGVEVRDFMTYDELAGYYQRSKRVLVPCEPDGGGERAVVEGRACGCEVEVAPDNPKLASLLDVPLRSHEWYADVLERAILDVLDGRRIGDEDRLRGQRRARNAVLADKLRRAPSTIGIRARDAWGSRRAG